MHKPKHKPKKNKPKKQTKKQTNRITRCLYLFMYSSRSGNAFDIYRVIMASDAGLQSLPMKIYNGTNASAGTGSAKIVGVAVRTDVNRLVAVDESNRMIYIFALQNFFVFDPVYFAKGMLLHNTSYGTSAYKDLEFVGGTKHFLVSLELRGSSRAELYVQCAQCKDGGTTDISKGEAESQGDCTACSPGFYKLSNNSGCAPCTCKEEGEYRTGQECTSGTDKFNVACRPCKSFCETGQFFNTTCTRKSVGYLLDVDFTDTSVCLSCGTPQSNQCPASALPQSPDGQDSLCQGYDCLRRQAMFYPFDGYDMERDVGPLKRNLQFMSMSSRSTGPRGVFSLEKLSRTGQSSAFFNASNHEYFRIPAITTSLFSRELGHRIVSNTSVWEQGMTIALWIMFQRSPLTSTNAGKWQYIIELSNGFSTEQIYIRRMHNSSQMVFGVSHTFGSVKREHVVDIQLQADDSSMLWTHVAWTIEPLPMSLYYDARWNVYRNGQIVLDNAEGVMPIDGPYTQNYIGYSSAASYANAAFLHAYVDDLRVFERALSAWTISNGLFNMHQCCGSVVGTYIDARVPCTGYERYNQRPCKVCQSDCGPMKFIDNWNLRCRQGSVDDSTVCKPCSSCGQDKYTGRLCSGTAFYEEALCYPCRSVFIHPCIFFAIQEKSDAWMINT
jgi:hypothetical protein